MGTRNKYGEELIRWAKDHYWDSLEKDKHLILHHLRTFAGEDKPDHRIREMHDRVYYGCRCLENEMEITWRHEGRIARMNGKSLEDNPYLPAMGSSRDWAEGWKEADILKNQKYCHHCGQEIK